MAEEMARLNPSLLSRLWRGELGSSPPESNYAFYQDGQSATPGGLIEVPGKIWRGELGASPPESNYAYYQDGQSVPAGASAAGAATSSPAATTAANIPGPPGIATDETLPGNVARQVRPGVTEVITPGTQKSGTRFFTNLLESGANPEQVAGFYKEMNKPGAMVASDGTPVAQDTASAMAGRLGGSAAGGADLTIDTGQRIGDIIRERQIGEDPFAYLASLRAASELAQESQGESSKKFNRVAKLSELETARQNAMSARLSGEAAVAKASAKGGERKVTSTVDTTLPGKAETTFKDENSGRTYAIPNSMLGNSRYQDIVTELEKTGKMDTFDAQIAAKKLFEAEQASAGVK